LSVTEAPSQRLSTDENLDTESLYLFGTSVSQLTVVTTSERQFPFPKYNYAVMLKLKRDRLRNYTCNCLAAVKIDLCCTPKVNKIRYNLLVIEEDKVGPFSETQCGTQLV